jgi:hypothetical protein
MQNCGSNRWWLDDAKLIIRRVRGVKEILKAVCYLLASAGMGLLMERVVEEWDLRGAMLMAASFGYGLYLALGVWEVTLNRVSGRISWRWGLGVPLFQHGRLLKASDHVRLSTPDGARPGRERITPYTVWIAGAKGPKRLAGSTDYAEALALAEAVARHTRLGLQEDDERVRALSAPSKAPKGASPPL